MEFDGFDFDAGEFVVVREAEINGERRLHGYGRVGDRWIFCVFS